MMDGKIREYTSADVASMCAIWNEVVDDGISFPQEEPLALAPAETFFSEQSYCGVAEVDGEVLGLYILHPNNVGRCGHIANASFAVSSRARGRHIGRALVEDSLVQGARAGFRILQFNAVVATNAGAIHLYEELGFHRLGTIPGGFHLKDGSYEDIILFYHTL